MRILHILSSLDPQDGGVSQAVKTIVSNYSWSEVITHEVICLNDDRQSFLKDLDFVVHAIGSGISPWKFNYKLISWFKAHLAEFDFVILHGLWHFQSFALYKGLKRLDSRPKFYIMPHGMLDPYFQRATDRKIKAIRNDIFWRLIEKKLVNFSDGLLFTCEQEKRLAHEPFGGYLPKNELVVGLGVNTPPPFDIKMKTALQNFLSLISNRFILYLSRIHPKKGVDILVDAFLQLKNDGHAMPDLVIAGPGIESDYGKNLLTKADSQIHFPGMLEGDAKWGAFYGCEAFVLPSHQENFGIAVVEAMACSKPVLISDQVNIWREISEGGGGIVEKDTVEGTYDLLKKWLVLSKEEKEKMGLQARRVFEEHFTVEMAAKKMAEVLSEK